MSKNTPKFSNRTYTIAGSAVKDGISHLVFGNGPINIKKNVLKFHQYVDMNIVTLPEPMTRVDATVWLIENGFNGIVGSRAKDKSNSRVLDAAKAKMVAGVAPIGVKTGAEVYGPYTFVEKMKMAREAKAARLAAEAAAAEAA